MEKRNIQKNIKHECDFCRDRHLLRYDYKHIQQEQKTKYIIRKSIDWVQQYFIEQESHDRNFQIISEFNSGQKNLFKVDSAEPDQIIFNINNNQFLEIQEIHQQQDLKQEKGKKNCINININGCGQSIQQEKIKIQQYEFKPCLDQEQEIKEQKRYCINININGCGQSTQQEKIKIQQYEFKPCLDQEQEIKEQKRNQQLIQHKNYVIKNIESQSLCLFYKSSLTRKIRYFNGFKEFLECMASFTIYKYYFQKGKIPTFNDLKNLYLPQQALQLIRDFVFKGYPYIQNLDKLNPQTYFEIKNDILSVNNIYKFEGDYLIKIKYIGNLRDYCTKDILYVNIALESVISNHIIYESQLDYIQELLVNQLDQKILDLLLYPIVVIELNKTKENIKGQHQLYLLFGVQDRIYYLGNKQQNEIYIESDSISNYQCSFEFLNGQWQIFDGYKNKFNERRHSIFGTWKLLYDEVEIKNNGQFKIKDNIFRLQIL